MSNKIYILKIPSQNVFNLIIALIFKSHSDKFLHGCTLDMSSDGLFEFSSAYYGTFALTFTEDVENQFRQLDWSKSIDLLDQYLIRAKSMDKNLLFATYNEQQLEFLKQHFKDDVFSIGVSYTANNHDFLLRNMAIQHVNHLQLGKIQPNEHDKKIMQDHTFEQQIAYYVSAFDHLVPKSHISDCDYDIPLDDFFSLDRLNGHLTEIGFALNLEAIDFYNQWFEYHTASKI